MITLIIGMVVPEGQSADGYRCFQTNIAFPTKTIHLTDVLCIGERLPNLCIFSRRLPSSSLNLLRIDMSIEQETFLLIQTQLWETCLGCHGTIICWRRPLPLQRKMSIPIMLHFSTELPISEAENQSRRSRPNHENPRASRFIISPRSMIHLRAQGTGTLTQRPSLARWGIPSFPILTSPSFWSGITCYKWPNECGKPLGRTLWAQPTLRWNNKIQMYLVY